MNIYTTIYHHLIEILIVTFATKKQHVSKRLPRYDKKDTKPGDSEPMDCDLKSLHVSNGSVMAKLESL